MLLIFVRRMQRFPQMQSPLTQPLQLRQRKLQQNRLRRNGSLRVMLKKIDIGGQLVEAKVNSAEWTISATKGTDGTYTVTIA